jgi:hypothetical protein
MVSGSRGPRTPSEFHALFSTGVGAGVPVCIHQHNTVALVLLNGLWVGIQIFMHLRARRARGVFIDEEIELFSWLGAAGFLAGLLFVSTYYVVFG